MKSFVERCCRQADGPFVTKEIVERELSAMPGPPRKNLSLQLREDWESGRISSLDLQKELHTKYAAYGKRWSRVARGAYGCSTDEEVRSFQNWIYNRIKNGDIEEPSAK